MSGPIPPFTTWVKNVTATSSGYRVDAKPERASGLESIEMDKAFLVTRITSVGGTVDEHPQYSETPQGLIYSGLSGVSTSQNGGRVEIKYEIENAPADGFLLPARIHLHVNDNINVRFEMMGCSVQKAIVIKLKP
jgi:hypothetical protein